MDPFAKADALYQEALIWVMQTFWSLIAHDSFVYWLAISFLPLFFFIVTFRVSRICRGNKCFQIFLIRGLFGQIPSLLIFLGFGFVVLISLFGYRAFNQTDKGYTWQILNEYALYPVSIGVVLALVLGGFAYFWVARKLEPALNSWVLGKRQGVKDSFSDVRQLDQELPNKLAFSPERYFSDKGMFLGLDAQSQPIYVAREQWIKSNVQIMGPPGTGKGVAACTVMSQAVGLGDAVIVFDPKDDEWAPHVLRDACDKSGKPFVFVDLRADTAQINPIKHITPSQLNELFTAAFALGRQGGDSDFYRNDDRKAARELSKVITLGVLSIPELYDRSYEVLGDFSDKAKGFLAQLEELASVSSVQTRDGVALEDCLNRGGCIYIVGSMRDEAVKMAQKMLFVRLVQLVESRGRGGRHVTCFLDEIRYLLSSPAINALGTVRDKGMNLLVAHQSLGDLEDCPADVSPRVARSTVIDTAQIRWCYRSKAFETAEWVSDQTGKIPAERVMRATEANEAMGEIENNSRSLIQTERNLIDTNTVQHLPDGCAVCIGVGHARLAFASPIRAEKRTLSVIPAERVTRHSLSESLIHACNEAVPVIDHRDDNHKQASAKENSSVGADLL